MTFAVVAWLDVFTRKEYKDIVVDSLRYCQQQKGLLLHCWCLMSNHIHLVLSQDDNASDLLRDFKKFTSRSTVGAIKLNLQESCKGWILPIFEQAGTSNSRNKTYQFLRQDNQPKELYTEYFCRQKIDYIHNSPVVAGIVDKAEQYLYSSEKD